MMPSPFPGMDPYLEGYLWPDVHHALAEEIRRQLTPKIAPQYVARIAVRFIAEELDSEETVGVMLPDVEVIQSSRPTAAGVQTAVPAAELIQTAPFVLPLKQTVHTRLSSVEIRDTASRTLVTSIEILSPVNKRGSGWDEYQQKRQTVMRSSAHLLEIDLLRPGRRPVQTGRLPATPYYVFLTRAPLRQIEVWPLPLADKLPILPVPLREPDGDVALDLGAALATIYDEARYDLDIDYQRPPEPPLDASSTAWAAALLNLQ